MTTTPEGGGPDADSQAELRAQVEDTRERLGETIEALAGKADVKDQLKQRTAEAREQARVKTAGAREQAKAKTADAREKASRGGAQAKEKAGKAVHSLQEKTPEQVRGPALQAAEAGRRNPGPLLAAGAAVLVAVVLLRRCKGRR